MKQITLFLMVLCAAIMTNAQSINNVPISDIKTPYIELVAVSKMSGRVSIGVDYGQHTKATKTNIIKDADNKAVKFESVVDALNFFDALGYEYIDAFVVSGSMGNYYHYLMKRKDK